MSLLARTYPSMSANHASSGGGVMPRWRISSRRWRAIGLRDMSAPAAAALSEADRAVNEAYAEALRTASSLCPMSVGGQRRPPM